MNRFYYLLACAGMLLFPSCSESEVSDVTDNSPEVMSFEVYSPSSGSETTRTYIPVGNPDTGIEATSPNVYWSETDKIWIWALGKDDQTVSSSHLFSYTKHGNHLNYATFEGYDFSSELESIKKFVVLYPNQEGATCNNNSVVTCRIPNVQKATINSFDPAAAICAGSTTGNYDTNVSLKHACAFLKITVPKKCKSVIVAAANNPDWFVTGQIYLTAPSAGSKVEIANSPDGYRYVMLTADGTMDCTSSFDPGTYAIAIAPSTGFPGLFIRVTYEDGVVVETTNNSDGIHFTSAFLYNLGTAPLQPLGN